MIDVVSERGYADTSVAHVVARAGVSRRTYYELFDGFEDCFLAAFDHAVERASEYVRDGYDPAAKWPARIRGALAAMLQFLDDEPGMGRLCVVETLGAGPRALERRAVILARITAVLDEGGREARAGAELPPLTAEAAVGGVVSVLHARLTDRGRHGPLLALTSALMSMIVLPYLGPAASRREGALPAPEPRARARVSARDPLRGLEMRLTYRTVRVLLATSAAPGASNRAIGLAAGVEDQGQMSKLLARLDRLGLIRNEGAGQLRGGPNAWTLTERGSEVASVLGA